VFLWPIFRCGLSLALVLAICGCSDGSSSSGDPQAGSSVPVPAVSKVVPSSIPINWPDTIVTVQGSGFTASSKVQVNGSDVNTSPGNFSGVLVATVPAADLTSLGSLSITVRNAGAAASNAITVSLVPDPVPSLTGLSPTTAPFTNNGLALTVNGSSFALTSVVQWNGSPRPTMLNSNNQIVATLSLEDVQKLGSSSVTVFTPPPGGGTSAAQTFTTYVPLPANDLAYSTATQLLYASVPSSGGLYVGNSIVPVDPNTGAIGKPIFVGSEPGKMTLSSDGTVMWVVLNGAAAVREVNLVTQTAGLQFVPSGGLNLTLNALAVMPGAPNTVAIAGPTTPPPQQNLVTIYDGGVARANALSGTAACCVGSPAFDPTGTMLYMAGSGYGVATVDSAGITGATMLNSSINTTGLQVDNGRAYLNSGVVLEADTGKQVGQFSLGPGLGGIERVVPDSTAGEAFALVSSLSVFVSALQTSAFDLSTFALKGTISSINVPPGLPGPAPAFARCGQDAVAFSNGAQLYIFHSPLVRDLSTSLADLSVTASGPSSAITGSSVTYTLTVKNTGPVAATLATLTDDFPAGTILQNAASSQGNCSIANAIYCDLGNLNSGDSANVQVTVTQLTPGTLTSTASVGAPQGDPNPANNKATSTTAVSGAAYSPIPTVSSISPALVQAGSSSFTLTVNGSGFISGSVVQLNSTPVPTTVATSGQLTATVDASNVASLGWVWISVANPGPGGGNSVSLPLTTFQAISLDANRLLYDPFTRKLYATVRSTATQVAGNSLVAIDPASGALGTPLSVGSQPKAIAESSDGKYLYIGLDGSKSFTRVDLTSMTQGPVFPLSYQVPLFGYTVSAAARDLAVAPGNDNLVAVDIGEIQLIDISGSTATVRSNTGTGSYLAFANASTLYSSDGVTLSVWNVTSAGLNGTSYPLNSLNLNNGFAFGSKLANGLIYGFGGGVADPTTTPPALLGQLPVSSELGSGVYVQGTGVAAEPESGRVFVLGQVNSPVLLSYDSNRYVPLNLQLFNGTAGSGTGSYDLIRWGRDGLAWHVFTDGMPDPTNNGIFGGSPGTGRIIVMRGPFVLPAWNSVNATPGLTSATPANATAGSGNVVLAIAGSGFIPGAVVTWNGAERTTTFVDSTDLTVAIPASDVSQSGTATLTVNNPGSSASNSISFAIN
jgi:uncharacterized repeat protein (TIGR01451 family)